MTRISWQRVIGGLLVAGGAGVLATGVAQYMRQGWDDPFYAIMTVVALVAFVLGIAVLKLREAS